MSGANRRGLADDVRSSGQSRPTRHGRRLPACHATANLRKNSRPPKARLQACRPIRGSDVGLDCGKEIVMPIYMRVTKSGLPVINGEATAKGHEKWIELTSLQIGQFRSIAIKGSRSEIVVTKPQDSSSAAIFNQSLSGEGLTVQIDFLKPSEKSPYLTYTQQDTLCLRGFP